MGYQGDDICTSPTIANGKVYILSWWWEEIYLKLYKCYCIDGETGKYLYPFGWYTEHPGSAISPPVVANEKIYVSSQYFMLCQNASNGNVIWDKWFDSKNETSLYSSPVVADGKVYIGCNNSKLYCFNADKGNEIWSYKTGGNLSSPLAVANQKLYFGVDDGKVYCFGSGAGNKPPNIPTITGSSSGKPGNSYDYKFITSDPDNDDVSYYIDWGDGNITDWTSLQASGSPYSESHIWTDKGTYTIKAKAKDINGLKSYWASLKVRMPLTRTIDIPFLNYLQNHPNMFPILQKLLNRLGK